MDAPRIACAAAAALAVGVAQPAVARAGCSALDDLQVASDVDHDSRPLRTVLSPDGDGFRDAATIRFTLRSTQRVRIQIRSLRYRGATVFSRTRRYGRGTHRVRWAPNERIARRTYELRVTVADAPCAPHLGSVHVLGIEAAFRRASYRPNRIAVLRIRADKPQLVLQFFRVDAYATDDDRLGAAVSEPVAIPTRRGRVRTLRVWLGDWPSGVYAARLQDEDGRIGYAPFVLRPQSDGDARAAVVFPTYTWQAYNFRDDDGDAVGDTWYARPGDRLQLNRPFLDDGMPPFFRSYDLPFLRWLDRYGVAYDALADSDLHSTTGRRLSRIYDLIVFPGHHEYVTQREFDAIRDFRAFGGNLAFLSANNFFWRVDVRGPTLVRVAKWRTLGRPEAALIGAQYLDNDDGTKRAPFVVRATPHNRWLFAGTGLSVGSRFGRFGIEIDRTTRDSPPGTHVVAEIPHLFGRGFTAQMTYHETRRGAKVFAAGAFTLAGHAASEPVSTILWNLWSRLSRP